MSREVVRQAVEGRRPERVPLHHAQEQDISDIVALAYHPPRTFVPAYEGQTEWGYAFKTLGDGTMGQVKEAALDSWEAAEDMAVPDAYAPGRFDEASAALESHRGKYTLGSLGITGFNRMMFIIGLERLFMALYDDTGQVLSLAEKVFTFETQLIEQWAALGVDAVAFGDDWGTQKGLMVSPELWRRVFKPLYAKQFSRARSLGLHVYLHTCGDVSAIMEDFVDIGVNIFNLNQINLLGIDRLAARFGGRVCFDCPVDHQTTLIEGDRAAIEEELRHMIHAFGGHGGRFIAHVEDYPGLQVPKETTDYVVSLVRRIGRYKWA